MKTAALAFAAVVAVLAGSQAKDSVLVKPADVAWADHPFIQGGKLAVQSGDPSTGPSVLLMKFPKGLVIPPHTHTSDETVTIVSGCGVFGTGEAVDVAKGVEVGPGGYLFLPGKSPHWAVVKEDIVFTVTLNLAADFHPCGGKK